MKNAEMNVVRFGSNDVIATSCNHSLDHYMITGVKANVGYEKFIWDTKNSSWSSSTFGALEKTDFATTPTTSNIGQYFVYNSNTEKYELCSGNHN